jgi:hypothetical protein
MKRTAFSLFLSTGLFFSAQTADAAYIRASEVRVIAPDTASVSRDLFKIRGAIIGSLVVTDTGTDGTEETIVGSGPGMEPLVSVHRADGTKIFRFSAFVKKMRQGVNVAVGDLDGDGIPEIIAAPRFGGSPTVRVFTNFGKPKTKSATVTPVKQEFNAFDIANTSGLSITACDTDADGKAEIIAAEGPNGTGEVRVYKADGTLLQSFRPFDTTRAPHGINVACGDLFGTGRANIVVAEATQGSRVEILNAMDPTQVKTPIDAFEESFVGGVNIAVGSDEGQPIVLVSVAGAGTSVVKYFSPAGVHLKNKTIFEATFEGGVLAATGHTKEGTAYLAAAPTSPLYSPGKSVEKLAEVDLAEQRMYAWENNLLQRTYLISSGLKSTPTPPGDYKVIIKPLFVDYTKVYGPNDPRNYDFPNTRWNLMFRPHYYIHTAWWHNDFGRPRSHGCVNTYADDAEWIYNWAPIGTRVNIVASLADTANVASVHTP